MSFFKALTSNFKIQILITIMREFDLILCNKTSLNILYNLSRLSNKLGDERRVQDEARMKNVTTDP